MSKHPTNRFQGAQFGQQTSHSFEVGSTGAYTVLVSSDLDNESVNYDSYSVNATNSGFFSASIGIYPFLNAEIELGNDLPMMLGLKLRLFEWGIVSLAGRVQYGAYMAGGQSELLGRGYLLNVIAQNYEGLVGIKALDMWTINLGYYSYLYEQYLEFFDKGIPPGGKGGMIIGYYLGNRFNIGWAQINLNLSKAKINYGDQIRSDIFLGWSLGLKF